MADSTTTITTTTAPGSSYNVFDLQLYHLFIFPSSWLCFVLIGKFFFETGLGSYHSTSSKQWATLCKSLFLVTFVTACTLLELVTFEILDVLHPALRLFVWTSSLAILALLLNVCIPAVLAMSAGLHKNLSVRVSFVLGGLSVLAFQAVMWLTGSVLRWTHPRAPRAAAAAAAAAAGAAAGAVGIGGGGLAAWLAPASPSAEAPLVYRLLDYLILFDVQVRRRALPDCSLSVHSLSPPPLPLIPPPPLLLLLLVSLPGVHRQHRRAGHRRRGRHLRLRHGLLPPRTTPHLPRRRRRAGEPPPALARRLDEPRAPLAQRQLIPPPPPPPTHTQLRRREASLAQILREIATRKKQILVISLNNKPAPGAAAAVVDAGSSSSSSSGGSGVAAGAAGGALLSGLVGLSTRSRSHDGHDVDADAMRAQGLPAAAARAGSATAPAALHSLLSGAADEDERFRLARLAHDVGVLEALSEELFAEIVELRVRG